MSNLGVDIGVGLPNAESINSLLTPSYQDVFGQPGDTARPYDTEASMLPEGFRDVQVWRDLADTIDEVFSVEIGSMIRDLFGLVDLRYVTEAPTMDREILLKTAARIGWNVGDLNVFSNDDLRNFIRFSPEFWKEKGCHDFIQYMNFVINANLNLKYLWTEDYVTFVEEGASVIGTPVWEGGTWYPTSHVYLTYDISKFTSTVNPNFSSQQALARFFYSIAPINLVIKSFLQTLEIEFAPLNFTMDVMVREWYPHR